MCILVFQALATKDNQELMVALDTFQLLLTLLLLYLVLRTKKR